MTPTQGTQLYQIVSLLARYALVALGAGFFFFAARGVITGAIHLVRRKNKETARRVVGWLKPSAPRFTSMPDNLAMGGGGKLPLYRDGVIGSSRVCDTVLDHESVLPEHAQATLAQLDGGSRGMRFLAIGGSDVTVNGKPPDEKLPARDGSRVTIGPLRFTLLMEGGPALPAEKDEPRASGQRDVRRALALLTLFAVISFSLLSAASGAVDPQGVMLAVLLPVTVCVSVMLILRFFKRMDAPVLLVTEFLCVLGMIVQYRLRPETALRQFAYFGVGTVGLFIVVLAVTSIKNMRAFRHVLMAGALGLMILPLAIGSWVNGAKNWIDLGVASLQPSELGKVALVIVLAAILSRRGARRAYIELYAFIIASLGVLFLQRDLGTALIYMAASLCVYACATGDWALCAAGVLCTGAAGIAGYAMFPYIRRRIAAYQNPWSDVLDKGYQIVQALMAIGSGGFFGLGLGNGMPRAIAAYYTDFVFAVICEEMGIVMGMIVLALYIVLLFRGVMIAREASERYVALMALGATAVLSVQTLIIVGGVIKLIPLTGVTLPFVSYGGSSMLSCMMLIGLLEACALLNARHRDEETQRFEAEA